MEELTAKIIEFWDNIKDTYPAGMQVVAADELTNHFMEEGIKLDLGEDFDPMDADDPSAYETLK